MGRTRNWSFILYPDECYLDYEKLLFSLNIPCCLSPIHEPDKDNISVEEQRKRHIHVFLAYDSVKTITQVIDDIASVLGKDKHGWVRPIAVKSSKAMIRYFIHADQPEKEQFEKGFLSLTCGNGFSYNEFIVPSTSEKLLYLREMEEFCDDNQVTYIQDLVQYARDNRYDTWYYTLHNGGLFSMKCYIDGIRLKRKEH